MKILNVLTFLLALATCILVYLIWTKKETVVPIVPEKTKPAVIKVNRINDYIDLAQAENLITAYRSQFPNQTEIVFHHPDSLLSFLGDFKTLSQKVELGDEYQWTVGFNPMYGDYGHGEKLSFSLMPLISKVDNSQAYDYMDVKNPGDPNHSLYAFYEDLQQQFLQAGKISFVYDEGNLHP